MDHNVKGRLEGLADLFGDDFDEVFNKPRLEAFLQKKAEKCECDKCKQRKTLASNHLDLKKRLAKFDGVYESLLSKLGFTEDDLKNVHFTFFTEKTPGHHGVFEYKGERHQVVNVAADMIPKFCFEAFEVNSAEDARNAADEADIMFVEALAHELQHVKQYNSGRFQVKDDDSETSDGKHVVYWDGERHVLEHGTGQTNFVPTCKLTQSYYENLPWEVDARQVAERVVDEIIAAGRLPNRPVKRKKKSRSDMERDIIGPAIKDILAKLAGDNPENFIADLVSDASRATGEIKLGDKKAPLEAASAESLLKLIEQGNVKLIGALEGPDGIKTVTGDEAKAELVNHLKRLIAKDGDKRTVH